MGSGNSSSAGCASPGIFIWWLQQASAAFASREVLVLRGLPPTNHGSQWHLVDVLGPRRLCHWLAYLEKSRDRGFHGIVDLQHAPQYMKQFRAVFPTLLQHCHLVCTDGTLILPQEHLLAMGVPGCFNCGADLPSIPVIAGMSDQAVKSLMGTSVHATFVGATLLHASGQAVSSHDPRTARLQKPAYLPIPTLL